MNYITNSKLCIGTGMKAKDVLGYIDPRVAQAHTQHAISWDQQVKFVEILDGEADGDEEKAIEIAKEVGLLNDTEADTLAFLLSNTPQFTVEEARALTKKLHNKVGYTAAEGGYPIVSCGTKKYYHNTGVYEEGSEPKPEQDFGKQSAYYNQTDKVNKASYQFFDAEKNIVEDEVTGLMWTSSPFLFGKEKKTFREALEGLNDFNAKKLGGFNDWRIPTIKELYSLADFSGSFGFEFDTSEPFFNTDFFEMPDEPAVLNPGDRFLDTQTVTSTIYRSRTLGSTTTMFGYNFRDGFLKGYPSVKTFTVFYVRGNTHYGQNMLVDNGDGTVSDLATGLMWMKYDSGFFRTGPTGDGRMDWLSAMNYCENLLFAGHDDWRLPDAKQLHSIVDYDRCPDVTNSPAIDPLFECTPFVNMAGLQDWSDYWTSTPFCERNESIDISFGRGMGALGGSPMDVHGAGAQRGDTRSAQPDTFYPWNGGKHPQGDETHARNMVRAVRVIGK
ncbi:Lcl C-terminal domain-containing protein [Vibrio sp. WJH972]